MKNYNIGWIGTGVMGRWMAHHILPLANQLFVYNRTMSKTEPLVSEGAIALESVKEIAASTKIIFTIVGHPSDIEQVYFGKDGLIENCTEGTLLVDMTTTKPSLAKEIYKLAKEKRCSFVDAPVSGGDVGAREARLSIMAGGDEKDYKFLLPYFEKMGKSIALQGPSGSGQHTKMANQIVIAGTMIGVSEALLYGKRANLDLEAMVNTISKGAAGCWSLDNLAPRVLKSDFNPGFMVDHFVKDMKIALEESDAMGLKLPGLSLVKELYDVLVEEGDGKLGTQALIKALEKLT
ncbi:MAG: NAD(P)-dependent oxidoreductase [Sphaerochaetaceae bacterium]|jgi:3-hydroxyisobutyrate dehydrogenase